MPASATPIQPRFQFRMRTLLLVPLAAAAIFVLVQNWSCGAARLDGYTDIEFTFIVIDVATNQPISNASIQLVDPDFLPSSGHNREVQTGHDGRARLIERCEVGSTSTGLGFQRTGSVGFPFWVVTVSADGYEPTKPRLFNTWTGRSRDMYDPTPPPIRIGLRRAAAEDR